MDDASFNQYDEHAITDIEISETDTSKAIHHPKENSTSGPEGNPANFQEKPKMTTAKPIKLMRQSLNHSRVAGTPRMAHVSPVHKGRSSLCQVVQSSDLDITYNKSLLNNDKKETLDHLKNNSYTNEDEQIWVMLKCTTSTTTSVQEHLRNCKLFDSTVIQFSTES